jgi:putative hydrolase of the HAD superfamily
MPRMVEKPVYVRAVFFDAAGTLLRLRRSVGETYRDMAGSHGVRATPEAIGKAFDAVFAAAPPLAFPAASPGTVRRLEKQWWYDVVRLVFEQVGPIERFDEYFESLFRFFSTAAAWELYPEVETVAKVFKERGLILGVISNFDSRIYPILSELGIFKLLDSVHISSREGVSKPDPAIFKKALEAHHLHPGEAVHIGDSMAEDMKGAAAAGLGCIYLNRSRRTVPKETTSIYDLSELIPIIYRL